MISEKRAATVLWPIDVLPVQSALLPALRPKWDRPRDTVLGPHTRLNAPDGPDRWGYAGPAAGISRAEQPHHGSAERPADATPGAP